MAHKLIENWPEESREAAQLVIDQWHKVGPWKRIVASKLGADYVITSNGLITCSKEPSGPRCFFAYDVPNNKATGLRVCE